MNKTDILKFIVVILCLSFSVYGIVTMLSNVVTTTGYLDGKVIKVVNESGSWIKRTTIIFEHTGDELFDLYDYDFEVGRNYRIYYHGGIPYRSITGVELLE